MTPLFLFSLDIIDIALKAPRTLKAPAFWKFSHLKNSSVPPPTCWLINVEVNTGVLYTNEDICAEFVQEGDIVTIPAYDGIELADCMRKTIKSHYEFDHRDIFYIM